uniref:Uncharacterized protein n=1 Tax=Colobus angolensis palliatus TaxID=336983 RepID=A0A2K5ISI3_COLAP
MSRVRNACFIAAPPSSPEIFVSVVVGLDTWQEPLLEIEAPTLTAHLIPNFFHNRYF